MLQTYKSYTRRTLAMLLAVLVAVGALFSGSFPVHAADGTISYKAGANIPYGSYFTSRMSFDGSNTAYCVEPLKKTPSSCSCRYISCFSCHAVCRNHSSSCISFWRT